MNQLLQNKKHLLVLLFVLLMSASGMRANPVDMNSAREVGFMFMNANTKTPLRGTDDLQLVTIYSISRGDAAFYVFNTPNGFVIVSADDCATPILGYSDEGQFELENIPVQLVDYLDGFIEQIQYGIENHLEADEATAHQWELVRTVGHIIEQRATAAVAPLLTDTWSQDCYYNNMCPEDPDGPCGHVYTGCVATSFAQVMHYWEYPINGAGSITYTPSSYPQQTANLGTTTYDWANMPDRLSASSSSEQIDAVATLMWHCGVAVEMDYGPYGSGAGSSAIATALVNYFGYSDELSMVFRRNYSDADWLTLMKNCLNMGRPILYGGGHAFVCDGYNNNNLLHFNWGWGGSYNGYFSISALNPGNYDFSQNNDAIINVHPGCDSGNSFQITATTDTSNGGIVSGTGVYDCGTVCTLTATANEGYVFSNWTKAGEVVSYLSTLGLVATETTEYVAHFQQMDGIVIGDATYTNYYLPTNNKYSLTQQIYTAEELNTEACEISSVSFFNTYNYGYSRSFAIYMVNTEKTTFEDPTDWITVTGADRVFSGTITMAGKSWTTIYFNTPFSYDGSSNVALVVDNNSNLTAGYLCCRTFSTGESQAIRISGTSTNYSPSNPSEYTGTLMTEKNQVIFGFPSYGYTVTATVGSEGGGTVSGGGFCYLNQPITLIAVPDEGYVFSNWTKNGTIVSYLSRLNLSVTESAEYVAHFELNPDGMVIGDATYTTSYLPINSNYSLSQQIYTADELGGVATLISSVSFFNTGSNSQTRNWNVYMVNTDKTSIESTSDWIPVLEDDLVFSGNVAITAHGWATVYFSTPFLYDGTSNVALIVDDNTNSNSYLNCRAFSTSERQAICIFGTGTNYDPSNPYGYTGTYTLMTKKNQVIFHQSKIITTTANPVEGGSISGGGDYAYGLTCTLTATPNAGYYFLDWTEDGEVVSYDATYSFIVNGDRNLVANFVEGESTCTISFDLYDSNNNGWSGNYLVVDYGNGTSEQLTLESGASVSYSREVATGSTIALSWIEGTNVYQCSFDIKFDNGVMIYHKSGLSANFQQELYVNCATATAPRTITVVADPEEGGMVEGAGTYDAGTVLTLTATPNAGYSFVQWRENGTAVSSDANYSFIVSSDRNLVAFFSLPLTISVTTNMASGGTATGAGTFEYGNTCRLVATPNEGYLFLHWSKNGEVVSCNANYNFAVTEDAEIEAVFMHLDGKLIGQGESTTWYLPSYSYSMCSLSQQIYSPEEIGEAGNINTISYYNAGVTNTRSFDIYMVHTDKLAFDNNTDWITVSEADRVFSGNVVLTKGYWTTIVFDTPFAYDGSSNLAIIVDDNTINWSSGMSCRGFYVQDYQAISVNSYNTNYDPYNPSAYNGTRYTVKNQMILGITPSTLQQTITLSEGTNWFSTYLDITLEDLQNALVDALPGTTITIKSQNSGQTIWNGHLWVGTLRTLDLAQMYKISVASACEITLEGIPVNPAEHPVTINNGSNWIGFPLGESMTVTNAFAGFAAPGDIIKSNGGGQAIWNGHLWVGQLKNLESGKGYIYNSAATGNRIFTFPTGTK